MDAHKIKIPHAMDSAFDKTAIDTIDLLEVRLRRIEYAVRGHDGEVASRSSNQATAAKRLVELEHSLHQLASKSRVVQDLLKLHANHPDLFQSLNPDEVPTTLDTTGLSSIILASASSYHSTVSQLTSVFDVPVPSAELSAQLVELVPRIARLEAVQASQNADIAKLKERSAVSIQQWYTSDILHAGDIWAEMEGRAAHVEQKIRRAALAQRMDNAML